MYRTVALAVLSLGTTRWLSTIAAVVFLMSAGATTVSGATATLGVSVTVVRSCSIDTKAAGSSSGAVRLLCNPGAARSVTVGDSKVPTPLSTGTNTLADETGPASRSTSDARVITVNF